MRKSQHIYTLRRKSVQPVPAAGLDTGRGATTDFHIVPSSPAGVTSKTTRGPTSDRRLARRLGSPHLPSGGGLLSGRRALFEAAFSRSVERSKLHSRADVRPSAVEPECLSAGRRWFPEPAHTGHCSSFQAISQNIHS